MCTCTGRARWLVDAKLHWVKAHLRLGDDLNREGMFHAGFQSSEAPHAFMRISKESATLHIPCVICLIVIQQVIMNAFQGWLLGNKTYCFCRFLSAG